MQCSGPLADIHKRLGCVCSGWKSDEETRHRRRGERVSKQQGLPATGKWFGAEKFSTYEGGVGTV